MRMRSRLPTLLLAHSTALLAAPDVCIRRSELARTDVHGYATAAGRLRLRSRRRETALIEVVDGRWLMVDGLKTKPYPLAMPEDLLVEVREAAGARGFSLATAMRQSIKLGLPRLRQQLAPVTARGVKRHRRTCGSRGAPRSGGRPRPPCCRNRSWPAPSRRCRACA